jgi:hypothetical protein
LKEKREIEQSEARDKLAKVLAGMVPLGSSAYELITTIVVPLHEKKKREFLNDLANRLKKLEVEGKIVYRELAESEEFNTIITKAILLAQQNHQEEKLEALRNVVIKSAKYINRDELDYSLVDYFLSIIDKISPLHISILKMCENSDLIKDFRTSIHYPRNFDNQIVEAVTPKNVFFNFDSKLEENESIIALCWNDLTTSQLVVPYRFDEAILPTTEYITSLITDFGKQFLEIIENRG